MSEPAAPLPADLPRCAWARTGDLMQAYHDHEWGVPERDSRALWEKLMLDGFQAGLAWITILRKRPRFREVFAGFDIDTVAEFDESDVERLMGDAGIIRNRAKVLATIGNARIVRDMAEGELDKLMWSFAPPPSDARPKTLSDVPPVTPESTAMSKELRRRGFRFVGPTTMYALMQSTGMVDDHVEGCWRG